MKRRFVQDENGELHEVPLDWNGEPRTHYVMPDIKPYRSMIDGRIIQSRSRHREHLRANRCIEIGNETKYLMNPKPMDSPPGLKQTVVELANQKLRRA